MQADAQPSYSVHQRYFRCPNTLDFIGGWQLGSLITNLRGTLRTGTVGDISAGMGGQIILDVAPEAAVIARLVAPPSHPAEHPVRSGQVPLWI